MKTRFWGLVLMLALVLMCLPSRAVAQTSAGVVGGLNVSNIDISVIAVEITYENKIGVVGGLFVRRDFAGGLGLQVEGLFSQKGTKSSEFFTGDGVAAGDFEVVVNYLEVPVLVHASIPARSEARLRLFGGPAFAWKINSKTTVAGEEIDVQDDNTKSYDVGITVGGGLLIKKFVVDVRYTFSLINVAETFEFVTTKNRTFGFMVGWQFK